MSTMTDPETTATSEDRFIEVVELLLQQQEVAEARRESAARIQQEVLEQLQIQFVEMTRRFDAVIETSQAIAKQVSANNGPMGALSEWERQKQMILMGLDPNSAAEAKPAPKPPAEENRETNESGSSNQDSHAWLEHLDPNDPVLNDETERKNLVARLRKLEVELSLQRAKLARERSELDMQIAEFEKTQRQFLDAGGDGGRKDSDRTDRMFRFLGKKKD